MREIVDLKSLSEGLTVSRLPKFTAEESSYVAGDLVYFLSFKCIEIFIVAD